MTTFLKKNNFKHSIFLVGLILFVLVGFLGPTKNAIAVDCKSLAGDDPVGCTLTPYQQCVKDSFNIDGQCDTLQGSPAPTPTQKKDSSAFQDAIDSGCADIDDWTFGGCLLKLVYYTYFQIPSGLLWLSALFFNALISIVIQSKWYDQQFITDAWVVVRDLSNMFFILILLYIAVKVILDIGGHEAKKMIASVLMMAILINFSLFFTRVIIDSSNILALIFYNKLDVKYEKRPGVPADRPNTPSTPGNEKDLSGAMYNHFNATELLKKEFLDKLKVQEVKTLTASGEEVIKKDTAVSLPVGLTLLMMIISGTIMLYAAVVFFLSGLFFLGRLIDLWVLMIFSPFAFMSFPVPLLSHAEGIGWESWLKKLLATSFMAPIFMFILFLIFLLLKANIFSSFLDKNSPGVMATILGIVLPALIILGLLSKAKDFAKKGGGQFGEMIGKAGGVVAGLAIGGGIGLAAKGLQATVGAAGKGVMDNKKWANYATSDKWHERARGKAARAFGGFAESSTFDARKGLAGSVLKLASGATGLNLGHDSKFISTEEGGYKGDLKKRHDAREKVAEGLRHTAGHHATEELHEKEAALRKIALQNEKQIEDKDREIKSQEAKVSDAKHAFDSSRGTDDEETKRLAYKKAVDALKAIKDERSNIKNGLTVTKDETTGEIKYNTDNGLIAKSVVKKANDNAEEAVKEKVAAEKAAAEAPAKLTEAEKANTEAIKAMTDAEARLASALEAKKRSLDPTDPSHALAIKTAEDDKVAAESNTKKTKADVATARANITTTQESVRRATAKATTAQESADKMNELAKKGTGNSQNDYEDEIIPTAKHHVKEAEDKITEAYAKRITEDFSFHRSEELHESAHKVRMRAKSESHGEKKSGGHNIGEAIIAELAAEALTGGGDHGDKSHDTPAAPAAGGHEH